jgi:hypothetical protein
MFFYFLTLVNLPIGATTDLLLPSPRSTAAGFVQFSYSPALVGAISSLEAGQGRFCAHDLVASHEPPPIP